MSRSARRRTTSVLVALGLALALGACTAGTETAGRADAGTQPSPSASRSASPSASGHGGHGSHGADATPVATTPLRDGERLVDLAMPAAYTPSAPYGSGTDDYRCFVLDPHLDQDAFITGLNILPGNPDVVHHVILFQAPPSSLEAVEDKDASEEGEGWTCFGGTGVGRAEEQLQDAPWLGAWAPGGTEQLMADDVGVPVEAGSKVIMQVHYNLLAGSAPDVSTTQLRLAPASKDLAPLETMLLPAPVEMPCRPGRDDSPLCDRDTALADLTKRFGDVGMAANYLHFLCGTVKEGDVQVCDRTVKEPSTLRAVAGHMHLLGREISIEVNPGTPRAKKVLDLPVWDFDNQGSKPVEPVALDVGDTVRVTCRHDQALRDVLPAFEGQPERYVLWGEGTTDEMCLGILLTTPRT